MTLTDSSSTTKIKFLLSVTSTEMSTSAIMTYKKSPPCLSSSATLSSGWLLLAGENSPRKRYGYGELSGPSNRMSLSETDELPLSAIFCSS